MAGTAAAVKGPWEKEQGLQRHVVMSPSCWTGCSCLPLRKKCNLLLPPNARLTRYPRLLLLHTQLQGGNPDQRKETCRRGGPSCKGIKTQETEVLVSPFPPYISQGNRDTWEYTKADFTDCCHKLGAAITCQEKSAWSPHSVRTDWLGGWRPLPRVARSGPGLVPRRNSGLTVPCPSLN